MTYFLSIEWLKWSNSKSFRTIIFLYLILLPLSLMLIYSLPDFPAGSPFGEKADFFKFPFIWKYLGYLGSWIVFFTLGLFSVLLMTHEYEYRTFRQNLISGLERWQFLIGKIYLIIAISLFATFYYVCCSILLGITFSNASITEALGFNDLITILRYFIMVIGYMSLGCLIGSVLKKSGLAISFYLLYIMFLEKIFRWGIHNSIIPGRSINYYPANSLNDMMVPTKVEAMMGSATSDFFISVNEAMLVSSLYSVLFFLLTLLFIRRVDL